MATLYQGEKVRGREEIVCVCDVENNCGFETSYTLERPGIGQCEKITCSPQTLNNHIRWVPQIFYQNIPK